MGSFRSTKYQFLNAFIFLLTIQTKVFSYQYKVGDLDAWGLPTPANPKVYTYWSKNHIFKIGDSLCKLSSISKIVCHCLKWLMDLYFSVSLQCFCTRQVKIELSKSQSSLTTVATLKIQSCTVVHEQWQFSAQHHQNRRVLLHQWLRGPLRKISKTSHFCSWKWVFCVFTLLWSRFVASDRSFLSHRVRVHPHGSAIFTFLFITD